MAQDIPTGILSDRLTRAIRGRRVTAAVFTTFTFEPAFFEEEVLPILFERSFSHASALRLAQLEEEIRGVRQLAVYYDRNALQPGAGSARLDVRRIGISRKTGCFHPKIVAALVEETDSKTEETTTSLVLAVLSANLTRAGWWENLECAEIVELRDGQKCSFRKELLGASKAIRESVPGEESHQALGMVEHFVKRLDVETRRTSSGVLTPRLYFGQSKLPEFLAGELELPPGVFHLEVISPYFDATAGTLASLIEKLEPKSTTVFLPQTDNGAVRCRRELFDDIKALPNLRWGKLPADILRRSKTIEEGQAPRFVHAKVYRLWSRAQEKEYVLVGSVNLTSPAHSRAGAGNFEMAMLVQNPEPRSIQAWLKPIEDDDTPGEFQLDSSEDDVSEAVPPPITVTYSWDTGQARYFWEETGAAPGAAEVGSAGVPLYRIDPIVRNTWVDLPADVGAALRERLTGTSFLDIAVDGGPTATILVREEGMAYKPSLLSQLTVEEILHYWSLLSAEQREYFLQERFSALLAREGVTLPRGKTLATSTSLFDRFAGIFHAFARLEEHVSSAIEDDREAEAVYRLFGKKYDSLPSLIEKVMDTPEADPVNQYVTLLSAKQLMRRLAEKDEDHAAFFETHAVRAREVEQSLECIDKVRAAFAFDDLEERQRFFGWFDKRFLEDAKRPAEES